ncbi:MAG: hypothetical protein KDB69_08620 [Acidimicrobiia bacterium]|nr:hypothetical protein [Acidimicrobiia bacterium]
MRRTTLVLIVIALVALVAVFALRTTSSGSTTTTTGAPATTASQPDPTTSVPTTAPPAPSLTIPPGSTVCDLYGTVTVTGTITSDALVEASGLAVSRAASDVLWSHNDSRDSARLYAFRPDGTDLGVFGVPGGFAFDWEDIAAGPADDGTGAYLYVGDIGDNFALRRGEVAIHRVVDVDPTTLDGAFPGSDPIALRYPDGSPNAEAMFVDPTDPALYLITKDRDIATVYRGPLTIDDTVHELEHVVDIPLGAEVSGADISQDGAVIAFRGYDTVWMWYRSPGTSIGEALTEAPCEAPSPDEVQGEAIAFDGSYSYFTVSEEPHPAVYRIPFEG